MDVWGAVGRLSEYLKKGRNAYGGAELSVKATVTATGVVGGHKPTLEERVERLEGTVGDIQPEIERGDRQVIETLTARIGQATGSLERTFREEIEDLRKVIVDDGPKGLWAYKGLALVLFGLVLALLAEVASVGGN